MSGIINGCGEGLTRFFQEMAICVAFELYMYFGFKIPASSFGEIIFCILVARFPACSLQVTIYSLCAFVVLWTYEFISAFCDVSLENETNFLIQSFSHGFISKNQIEDEKGVYGDWQGVIFPYAVLAHYIYMIFVYCFIILAMICGLMIQPRLPPIHVPCPPILEVTRDYSIFVWSILLKLFSASWSLFSLFLDSVLAENIAFLVANSIFLGTSDMLFSIWTANAMISVYGRVHSEALIVLSGLSDKSRDLAWDLDGKIVSSNNWKFYMVKYLRATMRLHFSGFETCCDNVYADDGIHHFPALTFPITLGILLYGCKAFWEDKPRHMKENKLIIKETVRENAIIEEFESHLRNSMDKAELLSKMLAGSLGLLSSALSTCDTLLSQRNSLGAKLHELHREIAAHRQRFQSCVNENEVLCEDIGRLQKELAELRQFSDGDAHKESIRALKAKLDASNEEKTDARQQNADLESQFKSLCDAKAAAEAKTIAAREEADAQHARCLEEIDSMRQSYQQLISENHRHISAKSAAEESSANQATMIESLHTILHETEEKYESKCQLLQDRIVEVETQSAATIQAAEETLRSIQADLANLNIQHTLQIQELDSMRSLEERRKKESKKRITESRKIHRLRQKKLFNTRRTFMTNQQRLLMDIKNLQKDNQRLEHRLVQMNPQLLGGTQVIHDPHKDNEIAQLKRQLQQMRSQKIVRDCEVSQLQAESARLMARIRAMTPRQ